MIHANRVVADRCVIVLTHRRTTRVVSYEHPQTTRRRRRRRHRRRNRENFAPRVCVCFDSLQSCERICAPIRSGRRRRATRVAPQPPRAPRGRIGAHPSAANESWCARYLVAAVIVVVIVAYATASHANERAPESGLKRRVNSKTRARGDNERAHADVL